MSFYSRGTQVVMPTEC